MHGALSAHLGGNAMAAGVHGACRTEALIVLLQLRASLVASAHLSGQHAASCDARTLHWIQSASKVCSEDRSGLVLKRM